MELKKLPDKTFPQISLLGNYMERQMDGAGSIKKYKENSAI